MANPKSGSQNKLDTDWLRGELFTISNRVSSLSTFAHDYGMGAVADLLRRAERDIDNARGLLFDIATGRGGKKRHAKSKPSRASSLAASVMRLTR